MAIRWLVSSIIVRQYNENGDKSYRPQVCRLDVAKKNLLNPQTGMHEIHTIFTEHYPNGGWSAAFDGSKPPYSLALVRFDCSPALDLSADIISELDTYSKFYAFVSKYEIFKRRFLDQESFKA